MEAKIKLYIASSLDGYIARGNGSLDWLEGLPNPDHNDYGYPAFYQSIDTVIMGRDTYEQILSFGVEWPYKECQSYVVTSNTAYSTSTPNTHSFSGIDTQTIDNLKAASQKNIWLVGGGKLVATFLDLKAIDEIMLFVTPHLLGAGIRLFPEHHTQTNLKLIKAESYPSGGLMLSYQLL